MCSVDEQPTNDIFSEPHTSPQAAELFPSSNVEMVRATLLLFIVSANTLTPAPASVALASIRFKIRPSMDRVGIWHSGATLVGMAFMQSKCRQYGSTILTIGPKWRREAIVARRENDLLV